MHLKGLPKKKKESFSFHIFPLVFVVFSSIGSRFVVLPVSALPKSTTHPKIIMVSPAHPDQITSLPGAVFPFASAHYSGLLSITPTKKIHYYYVESADNPSTDPIMFWTNGGPGCSGMLALFTEQGPWRPLVDGTLIHNPATWATLSSMVFLEQPAGMNYQKHSLCDSQYIITFTLQTPDIPTPSHWLLTLLLLIYHPSSFIGVGFSSGAHIDDLISNDFSASEDFLLTMHAFFQVRVF